MRRAFPSYRRGKNPVVWPPEDHQVHQLPVDAGHSYPIVQETGSVLTCGAIPQAAHGGQLHTGVLASVYCCAVILLYALFERQLSKPKLQTAVPAAAMRIAQGQCHAFARKKVCVFCVHFQRNSTTARMARGDSNPAGPKTCGGRVHMWALIVLHM